MRKAGVVGKSKRSAAMDTPRKREDFSLDRDYQETLGTGTYLSYRRRKSNPAGVWSARRYDPTTRKISQTRLGDADDKGAMTADGDKTLTYQQAKARAEEWFSGKWPPPAAPVTPEPMRESAPSYTVKDAWADYIANAEREGVKGIKIMQQTADAHILPALGDVEVETLTREQIESWHNALAKAPKRTNRKLKEGEEPPAPKALTDDEVRARRDTANRIMTNLKAALNHAADRGKTGASTLPWRIVKPFQGTTSQRVRFLTVKEQQMLIAACDSELRSLVIGGLFTGARYGELCKVRVKDFDPRSKTLFIQWGKGKGVAVSRHVALNAEAVTWFKEFVGDRDGEDLMWHRDGVKRTTRAKTLADPDAWASYDQIHAMEKAVEAAGIDAVTFHELRHTYASTLINAGCPLSFVAKQLGHKDTRMCERHYGHIAHAALAASIEKLTPTLGVAKLTKKANSPS